MKISFLGVGANGTGAGCTDAEINPLIADGELHAEASVSRLHANRRAA